MRPTTKDILDATLKVLEVDKDYWNANKRTRKGIILTIKQMVSLLGREHGLYLNTIGSTLGLSHSMVSIHIKVAQGYVEYEKDYAKKVQAIRDDLRKKFSPLGMDNGNEYCCNCEVFKNRQRENFLLGFYCPIIDRYVCRDEIACQYVLSDGLNF